jgi:hypothetical protein
LQPNHVQRQLTVGDRLSDLVGNGSFSARELIEKCLDQEDDWSDIYEDAMAEATAEPEPRKADRERAERLAKAERAAADALWGGKPEDALKALTGAREEAFKADPNLGAWFLHWAGYAAQTAGDVDAATELYRDAARVRRDVGIVPEVLPVSRATDASAASPQAIRMAGLLQSHSKARVAADLAKVAKDIMNRDTSAGVHEEAIRLLGEYLGYDATRPEKTTNGKGPDVLWKTPDETSVLVFDAKTKKVNKHYDKDLIGKSAQHALWAERAHSTADRFHYLVGPRVPATPQATPPSGIRVIVPDEFARLARDTATVYARAAARNLPLFHAADIEIGISEYSLAWATLPGAMETVRLDTL